MKTKQFTKVLVPVILAFVLAISGFAMLFASKGYASASVTDAIASFEDEYALGTEIEIPDAYFTDGGGEIKATKIVYYPDGTVYSVNKFTPSVMGNYVIEYSATTADGDYLSETKEIYAYTNVYSVSGKGSEVSYGVNETYAPNTPGVKVSLSGVGEFTYNKPINIAKLNGYKPFISMFMTPQKVKEADAEGFTITLTDIYDKNNFVRIKANNTQEGLTYKHNITYFQAGASFQPATGVEWGFNKVHANNIFGFPWEFSFFGCNKQGVTSESYFSTSPGGKLNLYFDLETKQIRTQAKGVGNEVIDLDNPQYFTDLWSGFTTGEVFLSITATRLTKSTLDFIITDIAGEDLTAGKLVDDGAPIVTVNSGEYNANNLPHAIVGQPYPVFESTAYDPFSGDLESTVSVYQNYGSPAQSIVNLVNGKFVPSVPGKYYVVYSATDYSGNVGETVHIVTCDREGAPVELNVATEGRITASNIGEKVTLPAATATGGNGKITITPTVTGPNGETVEIVKGKFQPLEEGTYTVKFVAEDFVSTTDEETYSLVVSRSNKPVFEDDVVLSKYFIAGYDYTLPVPDTYDYSNNKEKTDVVIKVTDDAGEKTVGADRKVNFTVNEVGAVKDMTVKYITSNGNGSTERVYTVKVINARKLVDGNKRLDVAKYFYSEDVTVKAATKDIELIATKDGVVEFINPIMAPSAAINFFTSGVTGLGNLKVTLEDINDASKSIVIDISNGKGGLSAAYINGSGPYEINVAYGSGEFNIGYDEFNKKLTLDGLNYISLNEYVDGTAFNGFPSNKARLYFEFEGVTSKATVKVRKINTQELNSEVLLDRVNPRVYAPSSGSRMKSLNEIVTVYPAAAADVLDPEVPLTVTVKGEGGKVMTAIDGTVLNNVPADREYQLLLSEYGQVRVTYNTEDDASNKAGMPNLFNVIDPDAPVIKLSRNNVTSATKGSTIVLAPFTATDNATPAEKLITCCFVVRPSGSIFTVNMKDCNSFVANEVGTYVLRYMATDERGNTTIQNYTLTITG